MFVGLHFCQTWVEKLVCTHYCQRENPSPAPLFDLLLSASVQYQSSLYGGNNNSNSPASSSGSSTIVCERCGQVCRGEVVRVKNTHFHVQCFTCQGKKKPEKTHTYTQTNTFISFLSCDRFWFEWRKHTTTSRSAGVDLKPAAAALQCSPQDFSLPLPTDNRQPLPERAARQQFRSAQAHAGVLLFAVQPCSQSSI